MGHPYGRGRFAQSRLSPIAVGTATAPTWSSPRATSTAAKPKSAVLIFMSLMVNVVFRLALGLKCYDVSNSFRLYRGDDLRTLQLKCDNFDIVEEILVKLTVARPGYRIKEVPFVFEKRKAGKTKRNLWFRPGLRRHPCAIDENEV